MALFHLLPDEHVRVDMSAPASTMVFPLLEMIVLTAFFWGVVGFMDRPDQMLDRNIRNLVVALWALIVAWRFVLPAARARHQRFIVTNRRVIARTDRLTARTNSIPLEDIYGVERTRRGIILHVYGAPRAMFYPGVPRSKKVQAQINKAIEDNRQL